MPLFNDYADKIKNASFNGASHTFATSIEIELSTTTPSADGTGITEPAGNGYASQTLTANGTNWSTAAVGSAISNNVEIDYGTATGAWGAITHAVIKDHLGNLIAFQALGTSKSPVNDDPVKFLVGQLTFDLN